MIVGPQGDDSPPLTAFRSSFDPVTQQRTQNRLSSLSTRDESLGTLVRSRRKTLGMEQQALSDRTRISPRTIRDIEIGNPNGRTRRTSTIERLMTTLGLPADTFELLGITPDDKHDTLVEQLLANAKTSTQREALKPVNYPLEAFIDAFELSDDAADRLRSSVERSGSLIISKS